MQRALGGMAAQVSELDRLSVDTREGAGDLVERLSARTAALADVARDLSAKQQTIDLALQHRQGALDTLLGQLDERGRSLHEQLGEFTGAIEDSFAQAQTRAQEIGSALSAMTKGTAASVTGQFESIRENAARERERTQAALQSTYDQSSRQLSELLDGAAERFQTSLDEVRKMAAEIQRELESARGDLRRGVFELPKETTEAANAMRRVVSDQIRALKELAAVVHGSGAAFDIAEPVAPAPAKVEPRREPPAPQRPAEDYGTMVATVQAAEPRPRTVAPAPAVIGPPVPAPATERGQSGWLSNLLAAASRDEPRGASRSGNETLETISGEIARLVDNDAAGELWERWRSGETGAISRRLYTAAGQQTFDDIRRRYRAEAGFRDSVNRYIQEFERLLAKIGQSDRDGSQARLAMLSDSGKVYVMLAHAAGRLG